MPAAAMAPTKPPKPALTDALTDAQLARAYNLLRKPHWPQDLEATLLAPGLGRCVRGYARHLVRADTKAHVQQERRTSLALVPPLPPPLQPPAAPAATTQARPHWLPRLHFDPRKAAANDHDD